MPHYYNDHDPQVCAWLRELIRAGHLPKGDVDERSILDVPADDLAGYTACHFFAGIGGWPLSLRLAGWPDDRPVWTGSPPCQPFSSAGQRRARDDARHLAPAFLGLVRACRPPMLFGEQVASASVVGKSGGRARGAATGPPEWAWLDDLSDGLEAAGYAVGAVDLPAAGVGAPHIRQRVFFGAVRVRGAGPTLPGGVAPEWPTPERLDDPASARPVPSGQRPEGEARDEARLRGPEPRREPRGLADADQQGSGGRRVCGPRQGDGAGDGAAQQRPAGLRADGGLAHPHDAGPQGRGERGHGADKRAAGAAGLAFGLADAERGAAERHGHEVDAAPGKVQGTARQQWVRPDAGHGDTACRPHAPDSPWQDADWLHCRDGKWRPVESGSFPLADGLPARVVRLRGYGNAIVPQAAAEFVKAFQQAITDIEGEAP